MKKNAFLNKFVLLYSLSATFLLVYVVITGFTTKTNDEINVKRINVVNEDGTPFFVIANPERTPPPKLGGVEYERAVKGGGAIIYNQDGDERGGIAVLDDDNRAMSVMMLDYKTLDAIGMFTKESADLKEYTAMLMVNDPDKERKIGHGVQRITLGTDNGDAGIIINGPSGKPRIVIQVDQNDQIVFNILDEEGNIIKDFGK